MGNTPQGHRRGVSVWGTHLPRLGTRLPRLLRSRRIAGVRTLALWDIDHRLLSIGSLSAEIYAEVFEDVTGRPLEQLADMTGRTGRAVPAAP